jgi:hypothetical protein
LWFALAAADVDFRIFFTDQAAEHAVPLVAVDDFVFVIAVNGFGGEHFDKAASIIHGKLLEDPSAVLWVDLLFCCECFSGEVLPQPGSQLDHADCADDQQHDK